MMKRIKILLGTLLVVLTLGIVFSFNTFAAGTGFADATEISVNMNCTDNISQKYEQDFYKFTISDPGSIYINFKHENLFDKNEYWTATIFDSETNELSYYSFYGTDTNVDTYKIGLESGTYYIRIRGGDWYNNGGYSWRFTDKVYTFNLKFSSSNYWERETNEFFQSSTPMVLNKSYSGSINDKYDVDFYKFDVSAAGNISLNFKHENIYDSSECWVATIFNVETNEISSYSFSGSEADVTTYKIGLDKGSYYLRIRGGDWYINGGYSWHFSSVKYTVNIKYEKSSYWEKESNDYFNSATKLNMNKVWYGSIKNKYDSDYYKVNIKKNAQLKISFENKVQNNSSEVYLIKIYDNKSNELVSKPVYANTTSTSFYITLSAGEYYVRISGGDWYINGGYSWNFTTDTYNFKVTIQVSNPSNLRFAYSTSAIKLAWDKVSGASGYKVYKYDTKKKKYVEIANTKNTSYKESNLKACTEYKYAVRAYTKVDGVTYYSSYVKITTATSPAQVTNLKFTSSGSKTGVVTYSKVSGATGYQIYYSTSKNGTYKKLATTSNTKYTNKKFSKGKTYYVKVRAYKKVSGKTVYGVFSTVKSVKIK